MFWIYNITFSLDVIPVINSTMTSCFAWFSAQLMIQNSTCYKCIINIYVHTYILTHIVLYMYCTYAYIFRNPIFPETNNCAPCDRATERCRINSVESLLDFHVHKHSPIPWTWSGVSGAYCFFEIVKGKEVRRNKERGRAEETERKRGRKLREGERWCEERAARAWEPAGEVCNDWEGFEG